jgi:HK97 family phage major capsid protein
MEPVLLETRASSTASPLIPPELFPQPVFPRHEGRIADRLPALAVDVPSMEYIRVDSVTGAADVVAEATAKPEIVLNVSQQTATEVKIAVHLGLMWKSANDFDAFTQAATTELQRLVIDKESSKILNWLDTTGILTHAATNSPTFDDIEIGISMLRSGPSLATPDLFITSPTTWSSIRREKNLQLEYYVAPDPSQGEVNTVWGLPTVVTTECADGVGFLLDSSQFGRLLVRDPLNMRIGYANDDLVRNILRYVVEERMVLAVERPSAILKLTGVWGRRLAGKDRSTGRWAGLAARRPELIFRRRSRRPRRWWPGWRRVGLLHSRIGRSHTRSGCG